MIKIIVVCITLFISLVASAFEPSKPINVIIGFAAGSGNEIAFRMISSQVEKANPGTSFIIQLRPGADSAIGTNALFESRPDGYTIGVPSYMGTYVANDLWQSSIKKFKYNSFKSITSIGKSPLVFIANINSRTDTMAQLEERVKTSEVTFAGAGGAHKLVYEFFLDRAHANHDLVRFAPHQSPSQAVISVATESGIEFGIVPITVALPLIRSGKIKALGITGNQSLKQLTNVKPIIIEKQYINIYAAWAIVLPPETPDDIVQWYNRVFVEAIKTPEIQKFFEENLIFVDSSELTSAGFDKAIKDLRNVWIPLGEKIDKLN